MQAHDAGRFLMYYLEDFVSHSRSAGRSLGRSKSLKGAVYCMGCCTAIQQVVQHLLELFLEAN